jgi:GNAT superfamily N-acetyltransferase
MSPITIREANEADLPAVAALYAAAFDDPADLDGPRTIQAAWRRLRRDTPTAQVLLAEMDGRPVGTLTFFVLPMLAHGGTPAALVEAVAVDRRMHRAGIGRALMDEAMARACAAGCYKLALSSNDKRHEAHAFYERLGYQRHGVSFVAHLKGDAS